jgi:hypothetical protein
MVVKGDPPINLVALMEQTEHARVVEEGARLRAALPAYLARRRALLNDHCPLIPPLLALVREYDPEPTTTEELWATGLGVTPRFEPPPSPEARLHRCTAQHNHPNTKHHRNIRHSNTTPHYG